MSTKPSSPLRWRSMATGYAGVQNPLVTTAVARKLAGFIWTIACEVQGKSHGSVAPSFREG